jgi:hypothetical protein
MKSRRGWGSPASGEAASVTLGGCRRAASPRSVFHLRPDSPIRPSKVGKGASTAVAAAKAERPLWVR